MSQAYPDPARRLLITIPLMIAMTMVAVDITIAKGVVMGKKTKKRKLRARRNKANHGKRPRAGR